MSQSFKKQIPLPSKPMTSASDQTARTKAKSVRDFYELGTKIKARDIQVGSLSRNAIQDGLTPDKAMKANAFATRYTRNELEDLCRSDQADKFQLGIGHVRRLSCLPADTPEQKQRRWELQRQAEENHWTAERLGQEIQRIRGPRKKKLGGRPFKRSSDRREVLGEFRLSVERFDRWLAQWIGEDPSSSSPELNKSLALIETDGDRNSLVEIKQRLVTIVNNVLRVAASLDEALKVKPAKTSIPHSRPKRRS